MGSCPSTEEAPNHSDGSLISRREPWAPTQSSGACNHRLLDELLLGERRFAADMHVRGGTEGLPVGVGLWSGRVGNESTVLFYRIVC